MIKKDISIVIGSYNRLPYLKATLETVREELGLTPHEIIVTDGGSDDGSVEWLTQQKDVISIIQHNRGSWRGHEIKRKSWGYFMNLGFKAASGKYICMLSDDCLVIPGAIKEGVRVAESSKKKIGAVAFYWRNWPEQKKYWVGKTFGDRVFVNHGLYLRKAMEKVGYADAENYHFYHADGDLSQKIWEAGYKIIDSPTSFIEHHSHANQEVRASNLKLQQQDWSHYKGKWGYLGEPRQDWVEKEYTDTAESAELYWGKLEAPRDFVG